MYHLYKYLKKKRAQRKALAAVELPLDSVGPSIPAAALTSDLAQAPTSGDVATKSAHTNETPTPDAIAVTESAVEMAVARKARRTYRLRIAFGLLAPFTLQGLDTTIIASALPFIATDFHEISQLNWIISVFNLTSAAFLPFWAQVADIFGRHIILQIAIVVVLVGSAVCTGSPTSAYGVLLFGRALQGVGAAGINISVRIILADRVSLSEYATNYTVFSVISAISFSIGPVVGGYLTLASWRWCFAINLPVAILAIVVVFIVLRRHLLGPQPLPEKELRTDEPNAASVARLDGVDPGHRRLFLARLATIDFGGQFLFLWGLGLLILAFTWAGGEYIWSSAYVLAPLIIGLILSIVWAGYEYLMSPGRIMARILPLQRAMIPWELMIQRDIGLLFVINFSVGCAMFAVLYFMDLYFALVRGNIASQAGIALLYFLPGLGVGAYMSIAFSRFWPRQTLPSLVLGSVTSAVGITVLSTAITGDNIALIYGMMALTGHGVGLRLNPASLHALAYFPSHTATITYLTAFTLPLGGTIALTLMSTVFNNRVVDGTAEAIRWGFISILPFVWLSVLASLFLGNVWLRKDGMHEVVNGAYLFSLITFRPLQREIKIRHDDIVGPRAEQTDLEQKQQSSRA